MAGFESGALGGLVQGSQQVTALEEVQVALQRDIDLAVVTGQLRQTRGLKRRAQQTTGYTWEMENKSVCQWLNISRQVDTDRNNLNFIHFFLNYSSSYFCL